MVTADPSREIADVRKVSTDWEDVGPGSASPESMRRRILLPFLTLLLYGFISLTPEEIECEHAAAAIEDCCPEVDFTSLTCVADATCGPQVFPAFDEATSECLQQLSCDEMRAIGETGQSVCERIDLALMDRRERYDELETDEDLEPIEGVCP